MIGSFWNLCRACPSMPVDKQLHSEYRSTYRWHEFTGNSRPEVVRRAPAPNPSQFVGVTNEPPLPRRKKCPELAYKSHEFIIGSEYTNTRRDASANRLARSEERGAPSRRSKSEGPPGMANGRPYPISTEIDGITRKQAVATVHELEPLVSNTDDSKTLEKQVTIVERQVNLRPFSQTIDQERLNHFITKKENFGFSNIVMENVDNRQQAPEPDQVLVMNGTSPPRSKPNLELWLKEMVELRKKAGEYKCRGWGVEIDPDLYKKQKDLWDQVSKRSSLSALSLASSVHRPITKEEKDQENNKKSTPLRKALKPRVPGQGGLIEDEISALPTRFSNIRHHLERTTGPDVEEGALLPSPTREKLMPAIPKRESDSQRGSPKKIALSRHGSPQKGSPQKGSPKKVFKTRSQSVGPGVADNESPKRHIRSASQVPTIRKKTPTAGAGSGSEHKARPYDNEDGRETAISISSCSPQPLVPEMPEEPLVKSPPEPTRVKSPEQIIMRSPDPVNWTVPLDTGKTFTVTQNVKDGENYSRPQSEIKASTPVEKPPPPPQSAPPQLTEQPKMDAWKLCSPTTNVGLYGKTLTPHATHTTQPGGAVRCMAQDPEQQSSDAVMSPPLPSATAYERARDRFDRFWGGTASKEENV